MRIAHLSSSVLPSERANSVQVVRMCSAFAKAGHDVTLFGRRGERGADAPADFYGSSGFDIIRPRHGSIPVLAPWSWAVRVALAARRRSVDLVLARELRAAVVAVSLGLRVVYEVHAIPDSIRRTRLERRLFRARTYAGTVSITQALADDYVSAEPAVRSRPVLVAPDGADPGDPAGARDDLGGRVGHLQVGYVGHLYPGRGIDVIRELAVRHPDTDFHVIGRMPPGQEAASIEPPNIRFHGFRRPTEVPRAIRSFDVVLAPYQRAVEVAGGGNTARWMSPLKIFEYMGEGRAIVASDLPVLREALEPGRNSLLCDPEDLEDWSSALTRLTIDPALRRRLGDAAHSDLVERFSWDRRAAAILESFA